MSLLRGDFYILRILRNSRLALTFAFMLLNTILMHGLRENRTNRSYWIAQPQKPKSEYHEFYEASPIMDRVSNIVRSQIKCCAHENNCDSFIWEVHLIFKKSKIFFQNRCKFIQSQMNILKYYLIILILLSGNKKLFQIWCWPGDCTKSYIQL